MNRLFMKASSRFQTTKEVGDDASTRSNSSSRNAPDCIETSLESFDGTAAGSVGTDSAISSCSFQQSSFSSFKRRPSNVSDEFQRRTSISSSKRMNLRDNKAVQGLNINKLKYNAVEFVGREKETKELQSCLKRVVKEEGKELVLIKGYSGSGKSELANTLKKSVNERKNGIFARGKFNCNNRHEPYSAIATAFGEICRTVKSRRAVQKTERGHSVLNIGKILASELVGPGLELLVKLIPELLDILPGSNCGTDSFIEIAGLDHAPPASTSRTVGTIVDTTNADEDDIAFPALCDCTPDPIAPTALRREVTNPNATIMSQEPDTHDFEARQEMLKHFFRVLTRLLCSYFSPMVIVLDDCQWADASSLKVIDYLLSDTLNSDSLLIIGCYRSNEVVDTHNLVGLISALEAKKEKFHFKMTHIELENMSVSEVNKILLALLSMENEEITRGLAEICQKRTFGNPFFLLEFITMLEEEQWIAFNLGMLKWDWDENAIENATMSAKNVVDLLQARMRRLSSELQLLLQYAACLGSSFRLSILYILWNRHTLTRSKMKWNQLSGLIVTLKDQNFIEECSTGRYRWVHDKVQEAALSLGDASIKSFQYEVGLVLYSSLNEEALEEILFDVVNLINQGNATTSPKFAELNLRAAEKAQKISAFHTAAAYVSHGIGFLDGYRWERHRNIALRLYSLGIDTELAAGRLESIEEYNEMLLSRRDCSVLDKLAVYKAKYHVLCNVHMRHHDATEFCLTVLKELSFPIRTNRFTLPIMAISSMLRTIRRAKKLPKDFHIAMKAMNHPVKKATMSFLSKLALACYFTKNDFLFILSITSMVRMTLDYGIDEVSGGAFATLGLLAVAVQGDFDAGSSFAKMGLSMARPNSYDEGNTLFNSYCLILPWKELLQSCSQLLLQVYTSGMRSGNVEYAMWGLVKHSIMLPYQMGKPLGSILLKYQECIWQMEDTLQKNQIVITKIFWQVMLNLTGKSKETTRLKGEIFDSESFTTTETMHTSLLNLAKLELFIYFGDYEKASKLALDCGGSFEKAFPGFFMTMMETFHRGIAFYAMARRTRKKKYKNHANSIRKIVRKWVLKGNPNVRHYHLLLEAEHTALGERFTAAEVLYKEAIVLAARTGHLHDAALFNEVYAHFLLRELSAKDEGAYRINEAIRFYSAWGAEAKVVQMLNNNRKT